MPFPPPRDHHISLEDAAALISRHGQQAGPASMRAGMLPVDALLKLIGQKGCQGLRVYLGRTDKDEGTMVFVGVDAEGNDMTDGELLDIVYPCPPFCDEASPLHG